MGEIRVHKNGEYTTMSNYHLKDKGMTLKAKGILSIMLSLPPEWDYSVAGLRILSKDGKDSTTTALVELENLGYLIRTKVIDEKGRFQGYHYDIYEKPQTGKPPTEKPLTENPPTENPPQYNIKESKIKESNIYKDIVEYLNTVVGSNYRYQSKATQRLINARLNDGFTVDDFKAVIEKKAKEWKGTEMAQYLRPETLFGTKFESYLNAPKASRKTAQATFDERTYTKEELNKAVTPIDELANIEW